MKNILVTIVLASILFLSFSPVMAKTPVPSLTSTPAILTPNPEPIRVDLLKKTEGIVGPLEKLIEKQQLDKVWPTNPIKYAIKSAVNGGVPANTIVLLLLLPIVATVIAATRQIIGIRGFGIFLPAALSVTFVAIGPLVGILLFIAIVAISTIVRLLTRKLKLKLQYLPRMALILWFVSFGVLGILFASPIIKYAPLANVSIFPVLVLTLLVEDFTRIQLGKSVKTAVGLTSQTLILALISYLFLTFAPFQRFVLLNPEISLGATFLIDIILGKYIGLRFLEYRRFKKLINSK